MKKLNLAIVAFAITLPLHMAYAQTSPSESSTEMGQGMMKESSSAILTTPPSNFKKVSSLVKLPDFLPGIGTLYVDPKTLPVGPYLGYDKAGKLVNVLYMLPLSQINKHTNYRDLGHSFAGLAIDHTDIMYNPGHAGLTEPHYHVIEWLITPEEQASRMQ